MPLTVLGIGNNEDKMDKNGQISLEACLLLILAAVAWLTMQGYLKRAIQANWKANADSFSGDQYDRGISRETDSGIRFNSSRIEADLNLDGRIERTFDVAASSGRILQVDNWGTYYDAREPD